jgi:hypothetical protein
MPEAVNRIRVGLVDSGAASGQRQVVEAAAAFVVDGGRLTFAEATPDILGHGSAVLAIVRHLAPAARFRVAQVFRERLTATAAQVAAAIDWLVEGGVDLINLSLGLREDRPALREACRRAVAAGVVLCAAAPARGAPVFPAAYDGVWRMTGDARCARAQIACLMTRYADFGAHVRPLPAEPDANLEPAPRAGGGASMGCAHMSGHLAAALARGDAPGRRDPTQLRGWLQRQLQRQAVYHGPERHS